MQKKQYLFCPGPVMVSQGVHKAAFHPDICHRVPKFQELMANLEQNLLKVFKASADFTVLLITGSGSAANETVISSLFTPRDRVLLINNGEFGDRLQELLRIHAVDTSVVRYEWGDTVKIADIEARLKNEPQITSIVMVHHETSTSVINPVSAVGQLAHDSGKTFFVDGVSSVGGEELDVVKHHIDVCTSSANKCLGSLPGVGIICINKTILEQTKTNPTRVAYLNLHKLYGMSSALQQTPNTPSVTMFFALDTAVTELLAEGLEARIHRFKRCAALIRAGLEKLGLKTLIDASDASNTVTSVFLPSEIDLEKFIAGLDAKGFTVYPGKGPLKRRNMFQVANMGAIDEDMCQKFLEMLSVSITEYSA